MTALALDLLHALCAANCRDRRGAAGSVLGTLEYGAVAGIGDGFTLGDGSVVGIGEGTTLRYGAVLGIVDGPLGGDMVGAMVGDDVAIIPCRFLMACICSSPIENGV